MRPGLMEPQFTSMSIRKIKFHLLDYDIHVFIIVFF